MFCTLIIYYYIYNNFIFYYIMNISKDNNDNIYLTINLASTSLQQTAKTLQYSFTNNQPILSNLSDYYFSVLKFNLPLESVPLTIPQIQPNQPNSNLTNYFFGIEYNGVDTGQYVIFETQNTNKPPPVQNMADMVITNYYFVYTYDWMLKIFNDTLKILHDSVFTPLFAPNPPPQAPYFYFNSSSQLIEIIVPSMYCVLSAPLVSIPKIFINYELFKYIDNFNFKNVLVPTLTKISYFDFTNFKDINAYGINNTTPTTPPNFYKFAQSAYNLHSWAAIRRIIITSYSLPCRKEFFIPVDSDSLGLDSNKAPIISDFSLTYDRADSTRSVINYIPNPQYRIIDMFSDTPIYRFDFEVFWEDIQGRRYNIILPSYQTADFKFAFLKKSLYKHF